MSTQRTYCGTPRAAQAGERMTVYGWVDRRRDHGGLIFLDVRDRSGVLQAVINPQVAPEAHRAGRDARLEWVLRLEGELRNRDEANVNPRMATGEVELLVESCTVLSVAKTPPFAVNEDTDVDEKLRLRYRYLDLRRERMQRNLAARSRFINEIRLAMSDLGFTEIETPNMVRATPEGARDYLVPSRVFPGSFYALPQSPQLYKQLCMVAGFDRYFQIARCFRDEDLRADRQPEFTQLDLEMSFVDEEDVIEVVEQTISRAWNAAGFRGAPLTPPFPRLTWREAMDRFGVDKPDTRFGMELCDVTDVARGCGFRVFSDAVAKGGVVKAIRVEGGAEMTRGEIEGELTDVARTGKAKGLAYLWHREDGWQGGIAKFFTEQELSAIGERTGAAPGDAVLMVADRPLVVAASLGALRNHLGRKRGLYDTDRIDMVWVTEFPMFEENEDGSVSPAHHPFTQPHPDDMDKWDTAPLEVRSRAYDLVLNGREVGSGSIRITDPELQQRIFSKLGIGPEEARQKFGFLLEAFEFGAPPHGGMAPGIDRLVMEGLGVDNIRDVIAFPKNQQAQELMTDAPAPVDDAQLRDLGLRLIAPTPPR